VIGIQEIGQYLLLGQAIHNMILADEPDRLLEIDSQRRLHGELLLPHVLPGIHFVSDLKTYMEELGPSMCEIFSLVGRPPGPLRIATPLCLPPLWTGTRDNATPDPCMPLLQTSVARSTVLA
jgi:hypothetical protein